MCAGLNPCFGCRSSQSAEGTAASPHASQAPAQPPAPSPAAWLTLLASRPSVRPPAPSASQPEQPAQQSAPQAGFDPLKAQPGTSNLQGSAAEPRGGRAPDGAGQLASQSAPHQAATPFASALQLPAAQGLSPGSQSSTAEAPSARTQPQQPKEAPEAQISPVAVAALWALLQGCLARPAAGPLPGLG